MKTICILIGLLCIYNALLTLGHPSGMNHELRKIALASIQGNTR